MKRIACARHRILVVMPWVDNTYVEIWDIATTEMAMPLTKKFEQQLLHNGDQLGA
jgi:hypothetical protein